MVWNFVLPWIASGKQKLDWEKHNRNQEYCRKTTFVRLGLHQFSGVLWLLKVGKVIKHSLCSAKFSWHSHSPTIEQNIYKRIIKNPALLFLFS